MADFVIINSRIVTDGEILDGYCVVSEDGKIKNVTERKNADSFDAEIIDAQGSCLCPGFIDLHIHGLGDYLIDNGPDDLGRICRVLPKYGVTSFLPTVCPLPKGEDSDFAASLAKGQYDGTEIIGFHFEGPFLALTGALPPEALGSADPDRVKSLIDAVKPYKAVFSISPDFERVTELIPMMAENNTPVFITHTKADTKQTFEAIKAGACHATHFYDVFYAPDETEPGARPCGAVEAILADPDVSVDFITDGVHVEPAAVRMALNCKGKDKVCIITDANIGAGNEPGRYKFGKMEVEIEYDGAPARMFPDMVLAGSGLTMNRGVKNAVDIYGIDFPTAVKMAGENPARVLRMDHIKGRIKEGYDSDIVLMDEDCNVLKTWVRGKKCYDNND